MFNFSLISRFHFPPTVDPEQADTASFPCPHLLCLLLSGGSAEKVKVNLEPLVDLGVNSMVLVADLLRCQALLSGLVLRRCAVLVCAAHKQQVPVPQTSVP